MKYVSISFKLFQKITENDDQFVGQYNETTPSTMNQAQSLQSHIFLHRLDCMFVSNIHSQFHQRSFHRYD